MSTNRYIQAMGKHRAGMVMAAMLALGSARASAVAVFFDLSAGERIRLGTDVTANAFTAPAQFYSHTQFLSVNATVTNNLFDAEAYASSEVITDLGSTGPDANKQIITPWSGNGFVARGNTTGYVGANPGSWDSRSFLFSGDTASAPLPAFNTATPPPVSLWTIHVNPTGAEVAGTPTLITLNTGITGELEVVGGGPASAHAAWNVLVDNGSPITVMSGNANQAVAGLQTFSDTGTVSFVVLLGSTFDLGFTYDLHAVGAGAAFGSSSRAEILASTGVLNAMFRALGPNSAVPVPAPANSTYFNITAQVGVLPVASPEPATLALLGMAALAMATRRPRAV